MHKQDLVKHIATNTELTKATVESVLHELGATVRDHLKGGGSEITLPEIGKLKVSTRAARTGRNPKTGEPVAIAAKTVVKYSPAKALTDHLN